MVNYSKGRIYKIESIKEHCVYYGSTCSRLCQKMAQHRAQYRRYLNGKGSYMSSFEVMQHPDAEIFLLEKYPCETKDELVAKEREYIQNNDCVNRHMKGNASVFNFKEYYHNNEDFRKRHCAKMLERIDCECGAKPMRSNMSKHLKSKIHEKRLNQCS